MRKRQEGARRLRTVRALLVALLVLLAGCATPASDPAPATPDPGSSSGQGPAWSFTAIDGATYSRDAPEGNATVLFFMATWCGSCRATAPVVAEVADEYAPRGVRTYSLDFDPTESADDLRGWQERYAQDWPHGVDATRAIQRTFEVKSQSSVVVLDADGNVVKHFGYGQVTAATLRAALDAALAA